jgi:hypothetical protein
MSKQPLISTALASPKAGHFLQATQLSDDQLIQFFRPQRIARLFDIDRVTLYAKVRRGELPPFQKVGKIQGYTGAQIQAIYDLGC